MNCPLNTPIVGRIQTIAINRGTSLNLKAQRKTLDDQPILTEAEEIYFIVKKKWSDKTALITKDLSQMTFDKEGYYHFSITPQDTENLPYGKYAWDFTVVEGDNTYRAKPARGYLTIGNSAGWVVNETE